MARSVTVASGHDHTMVGGKHHNSGDVVVVSNTEYAALVAAGAIANGTLTDNGVAGSDTDPDDSVFSQAALVAAPTAIGSSAAVAAPTKAEYDLLRTDVVNLRTTLAAALTALKGVGKPMSPT